jgi:formylglycine-generating enzyme required for sulfatase activity
MNDNKATDYFAQFVIGILVTVIGGLILARLLQQSANPPTPIPPPTTAVALATQGATSTLTGFEQLQTLQMQMTQAVETQAAADLTATVDTILSINLTETAHRFAQTETAAYATLLALTPTPTRTFIPTFTPSAMLEVAINAARTFSGSNADWEALYPDGFQYTFEDGVTMVLVPAGCFRMGSEDGDDDEKPVTEQCIDQPFWIDKYEVTNAAYGGAATEDCEQYSSDPQQPRICVTWLEARAHCKARGGSLPTEMEWEYAARGPDDLIYPWRGRYLTENAVHLYNSGGKTAPVGSRLGGASWVGALDMSGNVWEWMSSLYQLYPYSWATAENADATNSTRVLRGSSWNIGGSDFLRASFRLSTDPSNSDYYTGFRCAVSQ